LLATYSDVANSYAYGGLVSSGDTTRNYLENKLTAGSGITLEKLFVGGNERLRIASTGIGTITVGNIPNLPASKITSGIFPISRLASGTPNGTKFIRDDGVLAVPSGGGGGGGHIITDFLEDELPQRSKLGFRGLLVTLDDPGSDTTIVDLTVEDILAGFPPQPSNFFLASQTGGDPTYPAFRAIGSADIPNLPASKITSGIFPISRLASGTPNGTKFIRDDGFLASFVTEFPFTFAVPTVGTYTLILSTVKGKTLNAIRVKTDSGTATFNLKINSTNITGVSSITATSSKSSHDATAANVMVVDDDFRIEFTSVSSAVNFSLLAIFS
jgi:hypothetical protein